MFLAGDDGEAAGAGRQLAGRCRIRRCFYIS
jgi:hypothetical protein